MSLATFYKSRPLYKNKAELLIVFGSLTFLAAIALSFYFQQHLPTEMDTSVGRTHQLDNHGSIVYMTGTEAALFYSLLLGGWSVGAIGSVWEFIGTRRTTSTER